MVRKGLEIVKINLEDVYHITQWFVMDSCKYEAQNMFTREFNASIYQLSLSNIASDHLINYGPVRLMAI